MIILNDGATCVLFRLLSVRNRWWWRPGASVFVTLGFRWGGALVHQVCYNLRRWSGRDGGLYHSGREIILEIMCKRNHTRNVLFIMGITIGLVMVL